MRNSVEIAILLLKVPPNLLSPRFFGGDAGPTILH
jgi:hypothetical protein